MPPKVTWWFHREAKEGSVNLGLGELLPEEDLSGLPPPPMAACSLWWSGGSRGTVRPHTG